MNSSTIKISFTIFLVCAVIMNVSGIPDKKGMQYVQVSIQQSLSAFALARSLNAVISVAQGTEVSVEPMGMGLTLTPGEFLDPVNDLIERFSWVMLASGTSFGVQKIMLNMSAWPVSKWLMSSLLILTLILLWLPKASLRIKAILLKICVVLMFIRFSVPSVFIINELLYKEFIQNQYLASTQVIVQNQTTLQQLTVKMNENAEQTTSPADRLIQMFNVQVAVKEKMQQLKLKAAELANQLSSAIIDLMVVFILQTVILPLLILYVLYRLVGLILKQKLIEQTLKI